MFGRIEILINNGGIGQRGNVIDTDIAVQQRVMQVNYFGQIALTKAVLPYLIEQKEPRTFVTCGNWGGQQSRGQTGDTLDVRRTVRQNMPCTVFLIRCAVSVPIWNPSDDCCPGLAHTHISENALLPNGMRRGDRVTKEHRGAMTAGEGARHILCGSSGKEGMTTGNPEKWVVPIRRFLPWLYTRACDGSVCRGRGRRGRVSDEFVEMGGERR